MASYTIEINTGGSIDKFTTSNPDVTENLIRGNEPMIKFIADCGAIVTIPKGFMIIQREVKRG